MPSPPLTGKRVYVEKGVTDSFDGLESQIAKLEQSSPQTYYVVVVRLSGTGPMATTGSKRAGRTPRRPSRWRGTSLSKFLLRNGRRYPGKTTWNDVHRAWIAKEVFAEPAQQYVLSDGLAAVEAATLRCQQWTERLRELTAGGSWGPWSRRCKRCVGSNS